MAHDRHILPSNYPPSPQGGTRSRQPLTDSSGNVKYHTLASSGYQDFKLQPVSQHPSARFTLPTLPSQPYQPPVSSALEPRRHHATALEIRRAHTRRERQRRGRNPITESVPYQQYRARQVKDSPDDQKWPDHLEDAFLDALLLIPKMGRRKYSVDGKPHGRNELIAKYLWIAYCESLPPGVDPDPAQMRKRKQVSSHIQVLKAFMRGHASYERIFPPTPKNGIEDSFKNDPCLRALAEGRLPHTVYRRNEYPVVVPLESQPIRPSYFDMYMTVLRPGVEFKDLKEDYDGEGKFTDRVHTYAESPLRLLKRAPLESLLNWRGKFPLLAQAQSSGTLNCDIIHIDASLALRNGKSPDKAELWGRFEVIIPGIEDPRAVWRCEQSFYKPEELYGPPDRDPRYESMNVLLKTSRYEPGIGTYMRVTFAANPWAHALGKLADLQEEFELAHREGGSYTNRVSARQFIDQISMYQELFCSVGEGPWVKKAVIAWTFRKASPGESGETSWRYLDPPPPRPTCFEPLPGRQQVASAMMAENYNNAWTPLPQLQLQSVPFDPIIHGFPTPPHTAVLPSPFSNYGYTAQGGDLAAENLSFMSQDTQDSDSTLVEHQAAAQLSSFMSSASGVGGGGGSGGVNHLADFDASNVGSNLWATSGADSFGGDAQFLGGFPGVTAHTWDGSGGHHVKQHNWDAGGGNGGGGGVKNQHGWNDDASFASAFDGHLGSRMK